MSKVVKKKVLFTSHVANFQKFNRPFMRMLSEQGWEVHYASDGEEKILDTDKEFTIPFERSPFKLGNIKAYFKLKKIIDHEKYDMIHTHTPMGSVVTRLAARDARKKGTRVIYTAHGFHFFKGAPIANWLIYYPIEKYMARHTDTLITINNEDFERATAKFKTDVQYVPGVGIDPKKFDVKMSKAEKSALRKSLGLKDSDFVMIYVAELSKRKNQVWLIDAISELMQSNKNFKLLLPGSDSLGGAVHDLVRDLHLESQVQLLGYRDDVPSLMRISDLSISASTQEGLPVNIIEAMRTSLPVVTVGCRGATELIENGVSGIVVSYDDKVGMSKSIALLSQNPGLRSSMSVAGFASSSKYLIDEIASLMAEIYSHDWDAYDINSIDEHKIGKLVYLHSAERVKVDSNQRLYTDGSYNESVWLRYLTIAKDVTFLARKDTSEYSNETLSSKYHSISKKVNTLFVEDTLSSVSSFLNVGMHMRNTKLIRSEIRSADLLMIRMDCSDSYKAARYAKKIGKPYAVEVVSCAWDTLWNHSYSGKLFALPRFLRMRVVVRGADAVLYVTDEYLQSRYPSDVLTVGCSDVVLKSSGGAKRTFVDKQKVIIGTMGPLDVPYKGQDAVIKTLKTLNEAEGDVLYEYQMVGGGDDARLLDVAKKYNVEEYVKFVGQLSHDQVFEWLGTIDIYAQPSKVEGLPRALIEALGSGCPSVGSRLGGIPELLPKEVLFDWRNTESITRAIRYASISSNADQLSRKGLAVAKKYSPLLLAKKRNQFYAALVRLAKEKDDVL